jgi:hypothetical protein
MPARNCKTRPVSWKTHRNKALADAVVKMGKYYKDFKKGFIVWPVWIGFLTHRDNVGYFDGAAGIVRDNFFPHFTGDSGYPEVTSDEVKVIRDILAEVGLIIKYQINGIEYVLVPKVSNWSRIIGNISDKTDFPIPPKDVITAWEQRFNEVYTPLIRRIDDVPPESKSKSKIEIEINTYMDYFNLKTKKNLNLTPERKLIIQQRFLEGRTIEELKRAVDNFVADDWPERHKFTDIVYCIGIRNKVDNLDKWLNSKRKPMKLQPQPKKDCTVCGGSGKVLEGQQKGAKCFCF